MDKTEYLLRFDDIYPTMKWDIWDRIECLMDSYNIKPIIAVIPDNEDKALFTGPARTDFWEKVIEWQKNGWTIALHGLHHKYENRSHGIIKKNDYSEFAGVDKDEQFNRLRRGLSILNNHGIKTSLWVAPAHSFDKNTLWSLKKIGIEYVSDGYSRNVFYRGGLKWIPCQLHRFSSQRSGVWTVCKHPNMWDEKDLLEFERELDQWRTKIITFDEACKHFEDLTIFQSVLSSACSSWICNRNYIIRRTKDFIRKRVLI